MRNLICRDQTQADEREALIAAIMQGEQRGIGNRRVPEILEALRKKLRSRANE